MASPEDSDVDARFAAIVSGLAPTMDWDLSADTGDLETVTATAADAESARRRDEQEREDHEQEQRRIRRELRRAERAQEVAEFEAAKAELEAEYNSSDDHFTPPEPPPLPRLRPATVGAVLIIVLGIALIAMPDLLNLGYQLTLLLGALLIGGGVAVLVSRLRRNDDDGDPGGAVL